MVQGGQECSPGEAAGDPADPLRAMRGPIGFQEAFPGPSLPSGPLKT